MAHLYGQHECCLMELGARCRRQAQQCLNHLWRVHGDTEKEGDE